VGAEEEDLSFLPSFRGDAKHRTRNLEIPDSALSGRSGMTTLLASTPHQIAANITAFAVNAR
jgi:hypothetical protein